MNGFLNRQSTPPGIPARKSFFVPFLLLYAALEALTIVSFDGTGDAGDSIHHYLFARYAPLHPELYFDHWAKPVFVLLASPFAQWGFTGMKVFNALVSLACLAFTIRTAEALNLKNALVVGVLLVCAPFYYVLTFSGLTEPLFALFLAAGTYLCCTRRYAAAALLISFLPFVRSEGLIMCGVFGLYLILKGCWKLLPLLLAGHIAYSVAGYFVHQDLLWVFSKIPYATLQSSYGSGRLLHFVDQLFYIVGLPIYLLLGIGGLRTVWKVLRREALAEELLVLAGFAAFFLAHTLFWYLGIFGSMGMSRVLVGVMPFVALIALQGYNFLAEELLRAPRFRILVRGLLLGIVIVFPFAGAPSSIQWERDMKLNADQRLAAKTAEFIRTHVSSYGRVLHIHPYISEVMSIDHFDDRKRAELNHSNLKWLVSGDLIVWESWFAVVERQITPESLDQRPDLSLLYSIRETAGGREIRYAVYRKN
jgi:hypothetical protein